MRSDNLLFVYGTLMSNHNNRPATFLRKNARLLGEGTLRGKMFKVKRHPGVVYDPSSSYDVKGELYLLNDPTSIFRRLDKYEDAHHEKKTDNEYSRELVPLKFNSRAISCWTYLFNKPIETLKEITSGDFKNP